MGGVQGCSRGWQGGGRSEGRGGGAQVIGLLKEAFEGAGLDLFLAPYGVLPTTYECGIVEVPRPPRPPPPPNIRPHLLQTANQAI